MKTYFHSTTSSYLAKLNEQSIEISRLQSYIKRVDGLVSDLRSELSMVKTFLYGATLTGTLEYTPSGGNVYDDLCNYEDLREFYLQVKKDYKEAQKNAGE